MKIGIVTNLYPPFARGGAENVIVRTVAELVAKGHDVFVVSTQRRVNGRAVTLDTRSSERIYRFFPNNIYATIDDYKYPWIVRLFWHVIDAFSWSGAEAVRGILMNEKPDVVITHNLKGIGLRIPYAIHTRHIPHVHVLHDLQLLIPSGLRIFGHEHVSAWSRAAYFVYRAICRERMGTPQVVISPSHFLANAYGDVKFFDGQTIRVLPNPAPNFPPTAHAGRSGGPLMLLFVGQLCEHKGVRFLLDAFAKIDVDVRLMIAGDGPLRSLVEERTANDPRISYLGFTPPFELMKCMGDADVVVVPSLCYENSPTVIYESLHAGVPLLASRIGGVGELIRNGETGYLFTPGNEAEFLAVVRIIDARKDEFALAATQEKVRASIAPYEISRYCERLVGLCEEAIATANAAQSVAHPVDAEPNAGAMLSDAELENVRNDFLAALVFPPEKRRTQMLLCPVGLVGAGTTTVMNPLCEKLGLVRVSTGDVRYFLKNRGYNFLRVREIATAVIFDLLRQGHSVGVDADCVTLVSEQAVHRAVGDDLRIYWIHIHPPERFILDKLRRFEHTWLFKNAEEAVACYFHRKPLHADLYMPFTYTFDTSRSDISAQIDDAARIIERDIVLSDSSSG